MLIPIEIRKKKKKNLTGRAAVQVKGKLVKNVKKKSIRYPVSIVDLENYRNDIFCGWNNC